MNITKTSNSFSTSLLIQDQVPDFVVRDHPVFVEFIEKYYEFIAQANTGILTSDGLGFRPGVEYATKSIQDIGDIDTTNLSEFLDSFRTTYAPHIPSQIQENVNVKMLYKNLTDFYRARGSENSFRCLFRLLYNEEIEIYYPKNDVLIASGGLIDRQIKLLAASVENIEDFVGHEIIGKTSGITGFVEDIEYISKDAGDLGFVAGNHSVIPGGTFGEVYDPERLRELEGSLVWLILAQESVGNHGTFGLNEQLVINDSTKFPFLSTVVVPFPKRTIFFDDFSCYRDANSFFALNDNLKEHSSKPVHPPWGETSKTPLASNTGSWFCSYGQGEIGFRKAGDKDSDGKLTFGSEVLQIGNNKLATSEDADARWFVHNKNIYINPNKTYKMSIRMRHLGGNTYDTASAEGLSNTLAFWAGAAAVDKTSKHPIDFHGNPRGEYADIKEKWGTQNHFVLGGVTEVDDHWFTYTGYIKGIGTEEIANGTSGGTGGRDYGLVTSGFPYHGANSEGYPQYNAFEYAANGNSTFPRDSRFFRPSFAVNYADASIFGSNHTYSHGITQIDYIVISEMGTTINIQNYVNESSLLSTAGAKLQNEWYQQPYSYSILSKQDLAAYKEVLKKTVHPAGMTLFGKKITEISANVSLESFSTNLQDSFSPNLLNSLAGWWSADAIGPGNVHYKVHSSNTAMLGSFGSDAKNRFPVGFGSFEDPIDSNYDFSLNTCDAEINKETSGNYFGNKSLKIIDKGTKGESFDFPSSEGVAPVASGSANFTDYNIPIVIDPHKKWLLSFYGKVSNVVTDSTGDLAYRITNSFYVYSLFANSSGAYSGGGVTGAGLTYGNTFSSASPSWFSSFDAENTWERKSMVFDFSELSLTRLAFRFGLPSRTERTQGFTGNTVYHMDGFMLEEYNPIEHGTVWGQHIPSTYVFPGMNGANVVSWNDRSVNKHHVYANTHGRFYAPQYIANAINGMPAVRLSANTVKNTSNVYAYSSIGGTTTTTKPPTSGLQAKINLSNSDYLLRPVSNTWTIMSVVKTNLSVNSISYDTSLNPMIFHSGYGGNRDSMSDGSLSHMGTMSLGYDVIGDTGAAIINTTNTAGGIEQVNTSAVSVFTNESSPDTATTFRIVGVSVNAASGATSDLVNFHIDGRRFANSEINNITADLSHMGMHSNTQASYVTSIGKWAPGNNVILDTSLYGVNNTYSYGTADWDGDIAEILVFNEKLANTNIAKVEGYLAHKYGLQGNLIHKDGAGNDHPYKYQSPPAVGANNMSY